MAVTCNWTQNSDELPGERCVQRPDRKANPMVVTLYWSPWFPVLFDKKVLLGKLQEARRAEFEGAFKLQAKFDILDTRILDEWWSRPDPLPYKAATMTGIVV
ncbi:uncharacterized protein ARMOST_10000 [Armillaria ostoyae]|uniref:Uncharacterized protein n=1 Tax=Armillaria ostoyae TaxID=47428 RepID=A0A284RD28_ARMOS|nr:uncharacterized protein ARMOST_10000 [Armillaria ostoyae]